MFDPLRRHARHSTERTAGDSRITLPTVERNNRQRGEALVEVTRLNSIKR